MNQELSELLRQALKCSLFVDPINPGLSNPDLFAIGRQAGFQDGEIIDTIPHISAQPSGRGRFMPSKHDVLFSEVLETSDPSLLDREAADFVIAELNARMRADSIRNARLDRGVVVERAVTAGHDRIVVEGAITCLVLCETLALEGTALVPPGGTQRAIGLMADRNWPPSSRSNAQRIQALALVRDVVSRRTDGRPRHAEPLDAFGDALEQIGGRHFRAWWRQTVTELRGSDPHAAPVACAVLSAALAEAALVFAARHARAHQLGVFQSNDFDGEPRSWKAEKLIESAARGGAAAIFTQQTKGRAEHLNRVRQRVHVGRLLSDYPGEIPDLRPEEGREAKATAEQVVRAVLDWLERSSAS